VRRAPARAQLEPEDAARREAEAVVGRFAVDQKPRAGAAGRMVRGARAIAAALFADDEHQADAAAIRRNCSAADTWVLPEWLLSHEPRRTAVASRG
jgi:hypothetical protein